MENLQILFGDLSIEQFINVLAYCCSRFFIGLAISVVVIACLHSMLDGWAFRKGALYYGSLRYLNKLFKKLKTINSIQELYFTHAELRSVIFLLRFQRTIPKIMYKHLLEKLEQIFYQRKSELFRDEYIYSP